MADEYGIQLEDLPLGVDAPQQPKRYSIPRQLESSPTIEYGLMDNLRSAFTASKFNLMFNKYSDEEVENLKTLDVTGIGEKTFDKWQAFDEAGYAPEQASFYNRNVNSYKDFLIYNDKYKKTAQAKGMMASSGIAGGVASFLSETIGDPIFLATLPLGVPGKAPNAIKFAMVGAGGETASEIAAQRVDPTRTTEESVVNIAAATVLSGVLGAGVDTFTAMANKGLTKNGKTLDELGDNYLKQARTQETVDPAAVIDDSLSAARNNQAVVKPLDYSPGGTKAGQLAAKIFAPLSPANRSAKYIQPESQALNTLLAGNPLYLTKAEEAGQALGDTVPDMVRRFTNDYVKVSADIHKEVIATARKLKESEDSINEILYSITQNERLTLDDLYQEAQKEGAYQSLYKAAIIQRERMLKTSNEFKSAEVEGFYSRAGYGHQVLFNKMKSHADQINLRQALIDKYYKPMKDDLVKRYSKEIASKQKFKAFLEKDKAGFVNRFDKNGKNYAELVQELDDEIEDAYKLMTAADEDFEIWADSTLTEILNGKAASVAYIGLGKARKYPGFFLPREINPLEFQPWLETDFQKLNASYGRSAGAKIAFKRLLGDNTGEKALKDYEKAMDELISKARQKGDTKLADRLAKERNDVLNDGQQLLRQHEGTYASEFYQNNPTVATTLEVANNMISFSSLGNAVLGSAGEMAAIQLHHGITKVAPTYARALKKMATDPEFRAMAKKDLQATGRALELANNALVGNIVLEGGNLGDAAIRGFRTMEVGKKYYYRMTGQVYYDYMTRAVNGLVQQDMLIKNVKKLASGKAKQDVIETLAYQGIDESTAKSMLPYIDQHVTDYDGIPMLNIGEWADKSLVDKVRFALDRDMRRTSMMAQVGDLPIVSAHPAMRLLLKFKQWPLLATQNYMIPMIQRGDANALSGAMVLAGWSSIAYMARELAAGRELPEDPADILYAGFELSGGAGILPEIGMNYMANYLGINGGGAGFVGYNSLLEQSIGPAAGYIRNIDGASDLLPGGDAADTKDLKYLWKLMPLNNHPFAKQAEKALAE